MHQRKGTGTEAYPAVIDVDRDTSSAAQAGSPVDLTLYAVLCVSRAVAYLSDVKKSETVFLCRTKRGISFVQ